MTSLLDLSLTAVELAGAFLLEERPDELAVESKSSVTDAVTEMDRASEALIVGHLLGGRPDDAVLGEEGGQRPGSSGVRWIIDPLDGTVNYLYDLPAWAVSVAAEREGAVVAGAVRAPAMGLTWYAALGEGAWRRADGAAPVPIRVGDTADLGRALIATGFGYAADGRLRQARVLTQVIGAIRDIRRVGAAALDMCWVADGTVDGYFEEGTHLWDRAAAGLLVAEAGGVVSGLHDQLPDDAMTIATNQQLAEPLRRLIANASDG